MGTTLCGVAILDDKSVAVVNVGDSRVYLLREGRLVQISQDHSFVETLVRDGRLTRAQADVHPQRNVLSRAIGIEANIDVDGWQVPVQNGDRFLLCSDGLFNELDDARLCDVMIEVTDPTEAAEQLAEEANAHGGRDNISCVIADISDMDESIRAELDLDRPLADSLTRRSSAADMDETIAAHSNPVNIVGSVPGDAAPPAPQLKVKGKKPRRFGWRSVVFVVAILATFAAAVAATDWYYNNTYSVGVSDGHVVIYRGPPDTDILWFHPEVLDTDVAVTDLREAEQSQVADGVTGLSYVEATNYVEGLTPPPTTTTIPLPVTTTVPAKTTTTVAPPTPPAPATTVAAQ